MKFLFFAATILSLTTSGTLGEHTDYCNPALCPSGKTHIACNGFTELCDSCGVGAYEVTMDSEKQELILKLHNHLRNRVALGNQNATSDTFYPPAARMATLEWDNELAHIAGFNARRCVFGHDSCRNTATMRGVGQNIAIKIYYGIVFTDDELIEGFIHAWFNEYSDCTPTYIDSFPANYQGPMIGHFTQVCSDRSSKMGCAMVSYLQAPRQYKLLVCNYGLTNILRKPVYVAGPTASKCQTGTNADYPGLCSTSEVVSNNPGSS